uniref:Copper transport protein ATOX1 n=1 Tax=Scleropages formosus TaxID=113540 RepID=A0A8C9SW40_SCLFO
MKTVTMGYNQVFVPQKHEFYVDMTCEGCSGAVTRVLNKLDVKFDIDLPNKKVFIESDKDADELLETLKKTGKTVNYIGPK